MKRLICMVCMILCLLLCACSEGTSEATQTDPAQQRKEPETTERPTYVHSAVLGLGVDLPINSAYSGYDEEDTNIMAVLINEPFDRELTPTVTWNEGEYDRVYIVPKYIGTRVDVYEIYWNEEAEPTYSAEPVYSTEVTDGCIIYAALERPEGMPRWYIEVVATENDYGGMELTYNGKDGTPALEYVYGESYIEYTSYDEIAEPLKPVIYLYPEEETEVSVQLDYHGELTCTYPEYRNGWKVTAQPDGTLTDESGMEYNYLYWEGKGPAEYDFSKGFCVKGEDTAAFLETALEQLGLTRKEANEFIVFWLPMMQENPYNIIAFQADAYTDTAPLTITPAPETLLRVYMVWYGSETAMELAPQELTAPERSGFTVVEWGGCELQKQ